MIHGSDVLSSTRFNLGYIGNCYDELGKFCFSGLCVGGPETLLLSSHLLHL